MMRAFVLSIALILTACAGNEVATTSIATSKAIRVASDTLDTYNRMGKISSEDELKYQKKLLDAHDLISGVRTVFVDIPECTSEMTRFTCADAILGYVEGILVEVEAE